MNEHDLDDADSVYVRISEAYARGELPDAAMRSISAYDAHLEQGREPALRHALAEIRSCETLTERVRAVRALAIYSSIPLDRPLPFVHPVAPAERPRHQHRRSI